jgi:hypothetical protein
LNIENDFLKKNLTCSMGSHRLWVEQDHHGCLCESEDAESKKDKAQPSRRNSPRIHPT